MEQYIGDTFMILGDTLLGCQNDSRELVIPPEVDGCRIRRIGDGCSVGGATDTIIVSEGIEEIGNDAFIDTEYLTRLELPESLKNFEHFEVLGQNLNEKMTIVLHRCLSREELQDIRENCIPLQDGRLLLVGDYAAGTVFVDIIKAFWPVYTPARVERDMGRLFFLQKDGCEEIVFADGGKAIGSGSLLKRKDIPQSMIPILIERQSKEFWDNISELAADKDWQIGTNRLSDPVVLCFYRPEEIAEKDTKYHVTFEIRLVRAFFPNKVTVVCEGVTSYIYRDLFLTGSDKHPFIRVDYQGCIYDAQGNVSRNERVYARYKLLSMLS